MRMTSRRRRPWILLSLFALALALSAAGVIPVRRIITARMADLRKYISESIERDYGLHVSYASISPSILRSLEIRGLDLRSAGTGRSVLTARRVSIFYRIDKLLFGRLDQSLREIRLSGVDLDVDLERDAALLRTIGGLASPSGGKTAALAFDLPLKIRCRDLSAGLGTPQGRIRFDKVSADFLVGPAGVDAQLSAQAAFVASRASGLPGFSLGIQAEGRSDIDMRNARLMVSLSGRNESLRLSTQRFILGLRSRQLEIQKVPDRSPVDASARIDLDSLEYSASMRLEGYRPSEILSLQGNASSFSPWLGCSATGSFEMAGNLKTKRCEYSADGSIDIPESASPGKGRIRLLASGDSRTLELRELSARNDFGSGAFSGSLDLGTLLPEGSLKVSYRKDALNFSGDFDLQRRAGGLDVFSDDATLADEKLSSFALDLKPARGSIEYEILAYLQPRAAAARNDAAFSGEAVSDAAAPRIQANGSINLGQSAFAELAVYLSAIPSGFAYRVASSFTTLPTGEIRSFASDFTINAEAFISTDFRKYSYNLPQIVLSYDKKEGNYGVFSVSGGSTSFEASKISFFWNGYDFSGRLGAEMPAKGPMRFSSAFKLDEVPYQISGLLDPSKEFALSGEYGFTLDGSFQGPDILFSVGMKDMPLPLASFTPRLTLNAFGRFRDLDDWELNLNSSSLEQTGGFLPSYARIGFDGYFNAKGGRLDSITLQDSFSELSGKAAFGYAFGDDPRLEIKLDLGSSGGAESYKADILLGKAGLSGDLSVAKAPVERVAPKSFGGLLSMDAKLSGSLQDPRVAFSGSLEQAVLNANIMSAKASGSYGSGLLELSDFSGSYFLFALSGGKGKYRFDDSSLEFQSNCAVSLGAQNSLKTVIDGRGSVMKGGDFSPSIAGTLSNISLGKIKIPRWPYSCVSKDGTLVLNVGSDKYISAALGTDGAFSLMLDSPLAVRGFADGRIAENRIDADVRNLIVDFPVIWSIFGNPVTEFPSGSINADLKISGSLSDPDFKGSGRAENFVCKVPGFLRDTFGPVSADLRVDSKEISAAPFRVASTTGKGRVDVDLSMPLDGWLPSGIKLRARTVKDEPVRAAGKISGIDVVGMADADISIDLSALEMAVTGSVFLQDASIALDMSKPKEESEPWDVNVDTRMRIGIGRRVEFVFPNRNFPLLRTYFEPSSSLLVGYDSGTASYSLKGNARIRGGDVVYLKRNFYLKDGNILFNENESVFDPIVNLKAEVHDQDSLGNVLITMKVENSRLSNLKPRFEASPARSENQILAILGIPSQNGADVALATADVSKSVLSSASDVLAQLYGVRLFENTVRDTFGLDMFSLRTQVIQKLLLGAVDNTASLGEYFDNTTLIAGKYIGSDLFLQTMMQLRQGDSSNLKLESEFSMEWNTPYFKLLWELQPEHWEDLLVSDQRIGIYWSFSY